MYTPYSIGMGNAVIHFSIAFYHVEYFLIRLKSKLNAWFCRFMCSYVVALFCVIRRCVVVWSECCGKVCIWERNCACSPEMAKFRGKDKGGKVKRRTACWMFWIQSQCPNDISNINGFMEFMFVIHVANIKKISVQKFDTFFTNLQDHVLHTTEKIHTEGNQRICVRIISSYA